MAPEISTRQPISAMVVLGRGDEWKGRPDGTLVQTLTPTGYMRADESVDAIATVQPDVVIYSGGTSFTKARSRSNSKSESGMMLDETADYYFEVGKPAASNTTYLMEITSRGTTENLVRARDMLRRFGPVELLYIMTDELHISDGRVDTLLDLIFPGIKVVKILAANYDTPPSSYNKEKAATILTKVAMLGVEPGNMNQLMMRQHLLEGAIHVAAFALKPLNAVRKATRVKKD